MNTNVRLRQWGLLIGIVTVVVAIAFGVAWVATDSKNRPEKKTTKTETIRIAPEHLNEEHFVATYGAEMLKLTDEVSRLKRQLSDLEKKKKPDVSAPSGSVSALDDPFADAQMNVESRSMTAPHGKVAAAATATPAKRLTVMRVSHTPKKDKPDAPKKIDQPVSQNRTAKDKAGDLIPSGTFARAVVLNGVEAPTGGQANGNPMPMLLELTDRAVLPNRFRSDIRRCFVTANATGDLSSERVLIRLDRLSCLDDTGGAIDVKLTGYVTGEDGKTGLRARVVTRSGQAIANALLVGTLSGLGEAVSLAAQESTTNFAGTVTSRVENPWKSGLGNGMKDAMDRIADYYLRLADKIFPVLEVDAGRKVDIVITQSASIKREQP